MKHISILVPESAVLASIEDPQYLFTAVNEFLEASGKEPLFQVQLVGLSKDVKLHQGCFTVHTDCLASDVEKTDLVFIPAIIGDFKKALEASLDKDKNYKKKLYQ